MVSIFKPRPAPLDIEALKRDVTLAVVGEVERVLSGNRPLQSPSRASVGAYAFENPLDYRVAQSPRHHPHAVVTVDTLRRVADLYDVLRACINHLKREVAAVPLSVVARDGADDSPATAAAIEECRAFLEVSGGLGGFGRRRSHFESEILEDLCVVGAAATYWHETRGGRPHQVLAVDAATIKPNVDAYGWPVDEAPYEQWVQGVRVAEFSAAELRYDGIYPVTYSPYFKSPVEYLLNTINSALRADDWNRNWLTDGNIPMQIIGLPPDWSVETTKEYTDYFDALLAGDSGARQKTKFVPGGFNILQQHSRKDQDFGEFELWLLRRTCAIMGVSPASIGFAGEQYKVSQENSQGLTTAFGVGVVLYFLKAFYDELWRRLGHPQLETRRATAQEEDAESRARRMVALVQSGLKTINEARAIEGDDPVAGGDVLLLPAAIVPFDPLLPTAAEAGREEPESNAAPRLHALRQWEKKALRRVKDGNAAACGFDSNHIGENDRNNVLNRLAVCATADEVRALFREVAA